MLAPFALTSPRSSGPGWATTSRLAYAAFSTADPALVTAEQLEYPVQVNGKMRARLLLPADIAPAAVQEAALQHPRIIELLAGATPRKVIVVPGRMVSVVV